MFETPEDFLKLTADDITKTNLVNWFAFGADGKQKFPHNTKVKLDSAVLKECKSVITLFKNYKSIKDTETTIGRIVANVCLFDIEISKENQLAYHNENIKDLKLAEVIDYINKPFTKSVMSKADSQIADMFSSSIFNNTISARFAKTYIDRCTWLGFSTAFFLAPSLDMEMISPSKEIKNFKAKTIKENQNIIDTNDAINFNKIEDPVIEFARKDLKNNNSSGLNFYDSGFKGSWTNNYKNTALFRGISANSDDPSKFRITLSNLSDGIEKKDIATNADVAVTGSLGRAIDTRMGGYKTKIFNSSFPSIVLDAPGSDCKSPYTINVTFDKDNIDTYKQRFFLDRQNNLCFITEYLKGDDFDKTSYANAALEELKESGFNVNIKVFDKDDMIGKTVKMRSPHYCQSKLLCNVCSGNLFYKLSIINLGLLANIISGQLMNYSMKSFHDSSIKTKTYDIKNFIVEE
jgi:hypothetical protein